MSGHIKRSNAKKIFVIDMGGEFSAEPFDKNKPPAMNVAADNPLMIKLMTQITNGDFDTKDYIKWEKFGDSTKQNAEDIKKVSDLITQKMDEGYTRVLIVMGTGNAANLLKSLMQFREEDRKNTGRDITTDAKIGATGAFDSFKDDPIHGMENIQHTVNCLKSSKFHGVNWVFDKNIYDEIRIPFLARNDERTAFICRKTMSDTKTVYIPPIEYTEIVGRGHHL
jgi:hypothetical protein